MRKIHSDEKNINLIFEQKNKLYYLEVYQKKKALKVILSRLLMIGALSGT